MITCKEDFYKYYVEVNDREVFNKYCELSDKFGVTFYNGNTAKSSADSGYSYISSHIPNQPHNLFWCDKARLEGIYGKVKLTMADLKPRTKVVYEKVINEIAKRMIDGEVFTITMVQINSIGN